MSWRLQISEKNWFSEIKAGMFEEFDKCTEATVAKQQTCSH